MFLEKLMAQNPNLIDQTVRLYNNSEIQADSYVIDMDTLLENAKIILDKATSNNIRLFFMLKQLGRNPYIAKKLVELGYEGAVAVDFKEALVLMRHSIPLCNVGHLVQTPKKLLKKIMEYGTEVFTVYSMDKLIEISEVAAELNIEQKIMLKVAGSNDLFYSGQYSGIEFDDLSYFIDKAGELKNIKIVGVTAFPCYLFDYEKKDIVETNNYNTVKKAVELLISKGLVITHINTPSTTSIMTLDYMKNGIGNIGEPGHGLTGTTPAHAIYELEEKPCVLYVSEVSHNFREKAYVYGGGHYRRSHVSNCLIIDNEESHISKVNPISNDSIDYYFEINNEEKVSSLAIMAFRFQIFVTRSNVVLIEGLKKGEPKIVGVYSSLGEEIND